MYTCKTHNWLNTSPDADECPLCKAERQLTTSTVIHVEAPLLNHDEFKVTGTCEKCQQRPATEWWVADGGSLAWTHGMRAMWCKRCCVEEQLRFCREQAARITELERELAAFDQP